MVKLENDRKVNSCLIVLNYNDYLTTLHFVEHVLSYKSIDRIVIVDNSSIDESYSKLRKKFYNFEKIDLIATSRNGGYSSGNNFGVKYAIKKYNPKYFFISNPDVIVSEETIKAIISFYVKQSKLDFFISNPDVIVSEETIKAIISFYVKQSKLEKVGIISGRMITNNKKSNVAWRLPRFGDDIILSIGILRKLFGNPVSYNGKYLSSCEHVKVDVLPGSFFFISSNALQDVDFLDENVFLYCEERIISYKLKKEGYQNYLLTNFSFVHKGETSILKSIQSYLKRYFILQNSRKYYHTYYSKTSKVGILLLVFVTYIGAFEIIIWQFLKQLLNVFARKQSNGR